MSTEVTTALIVLGFIGLVLFIILMIALLFANQRRMRLYRKADILLEDLTYKAEILNPTVETLSKLANYIDVFEVFTRKSIKSAVKLIARNRDDIYKLLNRLKKLLLGEETPTKPKPAAKTPRKKKGK